MVQANLKRQILGDICKIRRLQYVKFIEITRALSSEIFQATAFRSHLKTIKIRLNKSEGENENDSKTKEGGEEKRDISK